MAAMVVARAKGSTAITAGYHSDGSCGDKDEDDSKGSSKNRECSSNNGSAPLISVLFFVRLMKQS